MASCRFADIWSCIQNLPPITQWKTDSMSIRICSSTSSQSTLNLSIAKNLQSLSFSILADFKLPISLWTSKPLKPSSKSTKLLDEVTISSLLINFIEDVLKYSSNEKSFSPKIPKIDSATMFKDIFNLSFLTLSFLVCIYEAPTDLRSEGLNTLKNQLASLQSREASKQLMRLLGSNLEEQWMRSVNLAITNWFVELQVTNHNLKTPSPLFSYAVSTAGLWKVQLYCPTIAMDIETSSNSADEHLQFSLRYHQLEGVLQFNYKVVVRENLIDVMVSADNIRLDVIRLVSETLMTERGVGAAEKHFPSRVSLQLTPILQADVLSVSVSKSSENPAREIGLERTLEGAFEAAPASHVGLKVTAGETMMMTLKPWKFEESVYGNTASLSWYLHDSVDGKEVVSSKPSKISLIQPKAWFKDRYSSAYRPFTRRGGVIFAGDEYGDRVWWKVNKGAIGKTMKWEIKGRIWLTYWPNKYRTFHNETRRLEFRETLHLTLA